MFPTSQKHLSRNTLTKPLNLFAVQDVCKKCTSHKWLVLLSHYLQQITVKEAEHKIKLSALSKEHSFQWIRCYAQNTLLPCRIFPFSATIHKIGKGHEMHIFKFIMILTYIAWCCICATTQNSSCNVKMHPVLSFAFPITTIIAFSNESWHFNILIWRTHSAVLLTKKIVCHFVALFSRMSCCMLHVL